MDFIRGFLGLNDLHHGRTDKFDDDCYISEPRFEEHGNPNYPIDPYNEQHLESVSDELGHLFDHMDIMFQNVSSLFNHTNSRFPDVQIGLLPSEVLHSDSNPRDQMLRPSDSNIPRSYWNKDGKSGPQIDVDLDKRVLQGKSEMLKDYPSPGIKAPGNSSFHKSIFISKIRRADGTVEEHRSVRDHSGNEVKTVRKTIGDQSYEVTTHADSQGLIEKKEDFINMNENDLSTFEERWNCPTKPHSPFTPLNPSKQPSLVLQNPPGDMAFSSIFKKLFGS